MNKSVYLLHQYTHDEEQLFRILGYKLANKSQHIDYKKALQIIPLFMQDYKGDKRKATMGEFQSRITQKIGTFDTARGDPVNIQDSHLAQAKSNHLT